MFLVDYTIKQPGEGLTRGRRRVGSQPKRGTTMVLAGVRVRVERVEDLRALPGKVDFQVHGRELPPGRDDGNARGYSSAKPRRSSG